MELSAARDVRGSQWRVLLGGTAGLLAVLLLGIGVAVSDRESLVLGLVTLLGIAGLRVGGGWPGRIALGLVFVDTAAWLVPAAVDNIANHDRFSSVALPVVVGSVALVGLVADVEGVRHERRSARSRTRGGPARIVAGGAVLVAGSLVVALVAGIGQDRSLPPGGVAISARHMAFDRTVIHVTLSPGTSTGTTLATSPASAGSSRGEVTIALTNHDLFWHTLTIDRLGVSIAVPVAGRRQVTFAAAPGTYTFYCAIPGHRAAGMEGTLVIDPPPT